jgi:hypothetical protein
MGKPITESGFNTWGGWGSAPVSEVVPTTRMLSARELSELAALKPKTVATAPAPTKENFLQSLVQKWQGSDTSVDVVLDVEDLPLALPAFAAMQNGHARSTLARHNCSRRKISSRRLQVRSVCKYSAQTG